MTDFTTFENRIGVSFNDKKLLQTAFTHRSFVNEYKSGKLEHNERLEFLGDAVLELAVTDFLYKKYPDKAEGDLTSYRAGLVNASTLATIATGLSMNEYLLLSKGEARDQGRARQYILANTIEALIGALYLDQGYDVARAFIEAYLLPLTDDIVEKHLWRDAKSRFQELAQEHDGETPIYKSVNEVGPDHDKTFTIAVFVGEEKVAEGEGRSKQEGEQAAAQAALEAKGWL